MHFTVINRTCISDREGLVMNIDLFPISSRNVVKYARKCCHMVTDVVQLTHERETNDGRRTTPIASREWVEPVQAHQAQTGISVCSEVEKRRSLHHFRNQSAQPQERRSPEQDRSGIKKAGIYQHQYGSVAVRPSSTDWTPYDDSLSSSYLNSFYDIAQQIATSRTNDGGGCGKCVGMSISHLNYNSSPNWEVL